MCGCSRFSRAEESTDVKAQDFWRIYRDVYRRRWLVIAIFASTMAVVLLGCVFMPRYYRASAYVMPSEGALSKPVIRGAGFSPSVNDETAMLDPRSKEEKLATFIGLAGTAAVREKAIRSLGLDTTPAEMEKMVKVESASGSIIRITALARSETGAIGLANSIAHEFSAYYRELTNQQARRNSEFLESELAEASAACVKTRGELQQFKTQAREAALPLGTAENPFLTQFYALRSQMDETQSQLRGAEGTLRAARGQLARQSATREVQTSTNENPAADRLQEELARLEGELQLARTRYTEKHTAVRNLKAQMSDVRERLERERNRMITRRTVQANPIYQRLQDQVVELETERASLNARLGSLASAMKENERRAGRLADTSVALLSKTRDYESAQERYDRLNVMLAQAKVEEKVSSSQGEIQVVDEAKSAVGPIMRRGPSPLQLLLLGLVLSAGLALGAALALAFLDDRLQSREDLWRELGLPVPAVIPELTPGTDGVPIARITELKPLSAHAESYRFLRTELMHANGSASLKTLLVATAKPGQGGSTTAVNLAIALAEVGKRVVLVDADLRRPSLHAFFGENNDSGLTTVLANGSPDAAFCLRRTSVDTLALLPAGPAVRNPSALLGSDRMRKVLLQLREHADYVVIDTPSAATFSDAAMLGPLVDGVVIVTRARQSVREVELHTKELFAKVGANVIGAVLNDAAANTVDSYYFHHHYYPDALSPGADDAALGPGEAPPAALETGGRSEPAPEIAPRPADDERAGAQARPKRRSAWNAVVAGGALALIVVALGYYLALPNLVALGEKRGRAVAPPAAEHQAYAVTVSALVRQPVDVRVEKDGQLLYEGPLEAGQQIWRAYEELSVWADKPQAIDVTVNGEFLGALGKAGEMVSRRFTAQERGGR
jgi:capsular exopolysaccharide synthesis family protein